MQLVEVYFCPMCGEKLWQSFQYLS
jgi:hypothetical protein